MRRLLYLTPIAAFAVLAFFLARSLVRPPSELPSALVDKPAPLLALPPLDKATRGFGPKELRAGRVTVVNVFASWCVPCRAEAPVLAALSHGTGYSLYGLVYKDTPSKARAFLDDVGNPFARVALDASGRAGIEWGVYGVPETYVVDGKGIVRERYVGPLTADALTNDILPAIARAGSP